MRTRADVAHRLVLLFPTGLAVSSAIDVSSNARPERCEPFVNMFVSPVDLFYVVDAGRSVCRTRGQSAAPCRRGCRAKRCRAHGAGKGPVTTARWGSQITIWAAHGY